MRRIVVIGGLSAGPAAAARAARVDPRSEVTLVEAGDLLAYGVCALPHLLAPERSAAELTSWRPERFEREKRVSVLLGHRAVSLDVGARRVGLRDRGGHERELPYDALVLATGSHSIVSGMALERPLKTGADLVALKDDLERAPGQSAHVLGAGYIGLEVADALVTRGVRVVVHDRESLPLPGLELEGRRLVLAEMERREVEFRGGAEVSSGWIEDPAVVVSALGTRPEVKLAAAAGLDIGPTGGVRVDERCETSASQVFAAGDCIETRHLVSGAAVRSTLAPAAHQAGRVAGANAAGGAERFRGVTGALAFRAFGLEVATVGLTEADALRGFDARAVSVVAPCQDLGEAGPLLVTLVFERPTRRLLGGNLIGAEGAALRLHALTVAVAAGMTANQLGSLDLGYAPSWSSLVDPLRVAARAAASAA